MPNSTSRTNSKLSACIFVLFLICVSVNVFAQNGRYDLRLIPESIDCATRKLTFVAQIQAASSDSTFILGTSNLLFTVSPSILTNPVLTSIDNFSGGRYGMLTLSPQGSVMTLNVVYNGSAPFSDTVNVTTAWTDIAHLTFDIPSQSDGCYSITWNGAGAFPSTKVSQVAITGGAATEVPARPGTFTNATGCAFAANLPTATISGDTTINSGEQATLKISFDGPPPTSIRVAGIAYNNVNYG